MFYPDQDKLMMIAEFGIAGIFLLGLLLGALLVSMVQRRVMMSAHLLQEERSLQALKLEQQEVISGLQTKLVSSTVQWQEKHDYLEREKEHLREELSQLNRKHEVLVENLHQALSGRKVAENELLQLDVFKKTLQEKEALLADLRQNVSEQRSENMRLQTQLNEERKRSQEKLLLLEDAKEKLRLEFTHLANRIFEEKGEKLHRNNQAVLDVTLSPLREQLKDFRGKVEEVYDKEARERFSLQREIVQLKELNLQMSQDAINLTQALKGESKTQGNWGEVILEKVLEDSGLRKGREYDTQSSFVNTEGKRRNPDVIIHLPENKDVIIDAKVSLVDYERYCSAINDEERAQALKGHIQSLRNHIKGLSFKDYENLEGIRTLDFVFIFVPIESAFLLAVDHDTSMFRDAYEKNIIIVSPTTLLATLRTVESIWRYERQNRNAEKIAKQAGRLHDQFVLVIEALEDVGRGIAKAQDAYETTFNRLSKGKGNLVKRVINLEKLGAKVKKKVPDSIRHAAQLDDEIEAVESDSLNIEYEDDK